MMPEDVGIGGGSGGKRPSRTYALGRISLDNGKCALVLDVLHDEPTQRLAVSAIHHARLDELSFEFGHGFGIGFRVEVDDDGVDHCARVFLCCVSSWGVREEKIVSGECRKLQEVEDRVT